MFSNNIHALVIGESWGRNERDYRHAFVGWSGQELCRMGGEAGLWKSFTIKCRYCQETVVFGQCALCGTYNKVSELEMVKFWAQTRNQGIAVTNVFHEHPENNNEDLFFGNKFDDVDLSIPPLKKNNKNLYLLKSKRHWLDTLHQEILDLNPNIVIPCGNTASWAVFQESKITDIRGTVRFTLSPPGFKAIPTFHPAALRGEQWKMRSVIISDLKKAHGESDKRVFTRTKKWFHIDPSLDDIEQWFKIPASRYAADIESGTILFTKAENRRLKKKAPKLWQILTSQISMVGFARDEYNALCIPFMQRSTTSLNYWSFPWQEVRAWEWVQYGLSTGAELVFQNGLYDVNRLLYMGIRPKNMKHDTMLRSHALFPEMLKGLAFLNSIFGNEIAWKTMYGQGESLKRDD